MGARATSNGGSATEMEEKKEKPERTGAVILIASSDWNSLVGQKIMVLTSRTRQCTDIVSVEANVDPPAFPTLRLIFLATLNERSPAAARIFRKVSLCRRR